ncbi:hypothetical protein DHEL01_v211886 [Diaporthe helianthi]|uniref:Uncharacterized protein n=1 Tax=Diaporthe helianthi TaxID=158607 RepID=A0A2P5HHI9_DIAHE|nr:hypothetical protein DHEL01_v211886 [Diaporthe helianthi]
MRFPTILLDALLLLSTVTASPLALAVPEAEADNGLEATTHQLVARLGAPSDAERRKFIQDRLDDNKPRYPNDAFVIINTS